MKTFDEIYAGVLNRMDEDVIPAVSPTIPPTTPVAGATPVPTPATPSAPPTTTAATSNHSLVTQIATMKDPVAIAALLSKNNVMLPINPLK